MSEESNARVRGVRRGGGVLLGAGAFLAASIVGPAGAYADDVFAGFDRFSSVPGNGDHTHTFEAGTWFDFTGLVPGLSFVDFEGVGAPDTIVERRQDAVFPFYGDNLWPGDPTPGTDTTIDIELVMLSLKSIEPVTVEGIDYDVFVTEDPGIESAGTMTLRHEWADSGDRRPEGTFDSEIWVYADVDFIPVDGGPGEFHVDIDGLPLTSFESLWSHGPGGEFVVSEILEVHIGRANHPVTPAPATLALLGVGGLVGCGRRRR